MPSRREWLVTSAILWSLGAYDKQQIYTLLPNSSRKRQISSVEVRKLLSKTPWWSNRTATRRSLTSGAIVAVRTASEGFKTVLTGDLERSGDEPTEWTMASGVTGWVQDGNSSSSWTGEWSGLRGLADAPQTESMIRPLTCKCSARVRLVVKSQILDPNALASVNNLCKLWNSSASLGGDCSLPWAPFLGPQKGEEGNDGAHEVPFFLFLPFTMEVRAATIGLAKAGAERAWSEAVRESGLAGFSGLSQQYSRLFNKSTSLPKLSMEVGLCLTGGSQERAPQLNDAYRYGIVSATGRLRARFIPSY